MGDNNGKGTQTQVQRTRQRCDGDNATGGDRKLGRDGSSDGIEGTIGIDYQDWVRGDSLIRGCSTGGIIAQLITETEDQLGDAQACIARVQKEMEKLHRRLENLKRLQALQQQQENS